MSNGIVLAAGDLAPDREDPDSCFTAAAEVLNGAELVFGQLETSFATHGTRLPQARHAVMARPECAAAIARAGFDVLSFAGNHCLDWGNDAFFETLRHLEDAGIARRRCGREHRSRAAAGDPPACRWHACRLPRLFLDPAAGLLGRGASAWLRADARAHFVRTDRARPAGHAGAHPHLGTRSGPGSDARRHSRGARARRCRAGIASLGHPLRSRHDRRLPARSGARGDRCRCGCHPRAPRAYPQGHRAHRREAGVLQPVQFRHRPAHDPGARGATQLQGNPAAGGKLGAGFRQPVQLSSGFAAVDDRAIAHRRWRASGKPVSCRCTSAGMRCPRIVSPRDPAFNEVIDYLRAVTGEAGLNARYAPQGAHVAIGSA